MIGDDDMSDEHIFDIDSNELFEGDFGLFVLPNGTLEYAMLCGKRCIAIDGSLYYFNYAYKLNYKYLSEKQLEKKELIQKMYNKYYAAKEMKKKFGGIKAKNLEIGQSYASMNKDIFLYYGHGKVTIIMNGKEVTKTGFIYFNIGNCRFKDAYSFDISSEYLRKYLICDMSFRIAQRTPIVCKTRKKFVAKASYKSPIIHKKFEYSYRDEYTRLRNEWSANMNKRDDRLFRFELD